MNRTELTEGNPMTITAFSEAIGLRAAAPQSPEQPHGGHVTSEERHNHQRDVHEAHDRSQAPRETTPAPIPRVRETREEMVKRIVQEEITKDIHRAEQSFVWREPVTVEEWLNGADGVYRSAFGS